MRFVSLFIVLAMAMGARASAQSATHEYRPEIIITSPRIEGYALQLIVEQHLETSNLAPNERIQGIALLTPPLHGLRPAFEVKQVQLPTVLEHRYLPTVFTTFVLDHQFELRSRTRVEFRNIDRQWSQRYQHRSAFGRDVEVAGIGAFTYAQVDFSADSRFNTLNRIEKTAGARVATGKQSSVDLFFTRQDDSRRAIRTLYALGALVRVAL